MLNYVYTEQESLDRTVVLCSRRTAVDANSLVGEAGEGTRGAGLGIRGQRGRGAAAEGRGAEQVRVLRGGGRGGVAGQVRGQGRVQAGRGRVREGRGETRVWKRSIPLDAALDSRAARRCRIPPVPARLMATDFSPKSPSTTLYLVSLSFAVEATPANSEAKRRARECSCAR